MRQFSVQAFNEPTSNARFSDVEGVEDDGGHFAPCLGFDAPHFQYPEDPHHTHETAFLINAPGTEWCQATWGVDVRIEGGPRSR
eukprot:g34962.t1